MTDAAEEAIAAAERALGRLPLDRASVAAAGRRWTIEAVRDQDRLLTVSEHLAVFPFGLLLWESAVVLADALGEQREMLAGARVLELGAGVGLAGLVAAALGASVTQTDHSVEALALCRRNAAANGISGIDWRLGDWRAWDDRARYDLVIGADVTYEAELFAHVERVLSASVAPGGRALLTDPGRTHTAAFIAALREQGWRVELSKHEVAALPPSAPGETVGVTLIEVERP